ncbi:MAG: hypothetical protein ACLUFI_10575 [Oscillospiraceae bacterium]
MNDFELQHLPEAYRPLSPWTYFGLGVLYSLPLVGWIFLIVHAVGSQNLNRRNYARRLFLCLHAGDHPDRGAGCDGRAERSRRRGQRDIRLRKPCGTDRKTQIPARFEPVFCVSSGNIS